MLSDVQVRMTHNFFLLQLKETGRYQQQQQLIQTQKRPLKHVLCTTQGFTEEDLLQVAYLCTEPSLAELDWGCAM